MKVGCRIVIVVYDVRDERLRILAGDYLFPTFSYLSNFSRFRRKFAPISTQRANFIGISSPGKEFLGLSPRKRSNFLGYLPSSRKLVPIFDNYKILYPRISLLTMQLSFLCIDLCMLMQSFCIIIALKLSQNIIILQQSHLAVDSNLEFQDVIICRKIF